MNSENRRDSSSSVIIETMSVPNPFNQSESFSANEEIRGHLININLNKSIVMRRVKQIAELQSLIRRTKRELLHIKKNTAARKTVVKTLQILKKKKRFQSIEDLAEKDLFQNWSYIDTSGLRTADDALFTFLKNNNYVSNETPVREQISSSDTTDTSTDEDTSENPGLGPLFQ